MSSKRQGASSVRWKPAAGAVLFAAALFLAGSERLGPAWSVVVFGVGIGAGWFLIPRFWGRSRHGGVAGALAGALVLGPGLRLAMRVVAMVDPVRTPEFTAGGTMFIIIGIGVVMGGIFGIIGNLARVGFLIPHRVAGLVPAVLVMLMIGLSADLRAEILGLGAGPWMNIPMFGAVAVGYGALFARAVRRLESRGQTTDAHHETSESATITLSNPRGAEG